VSEDRRLACGSEAQIFTVSLSGANILPTSSQAFWPRFKKSRQHIEPGGFENKPASRFLAI
jgi:hypothetical protein